MEVFLKVLLKQQSFAEQQSLNPYCIGSVSKSANWIRRKAKNYVLILIVMEVFLKV